MEKRSSILKIYWLIIFLALIAGLMAVFQKGNISRLDKHVYLSFLAAALGVWVYLGLRAVIFRRKLVYFIQRLLENQYQAGIKINPMFNDEIAWIEKLINKLADQLRKYDELQIDRISALSRIIDNIFHNVKEGIILYNSSGKVFQFNPAAQSFFQVEQENFSYDSLANQEANREFIRLLKEAIDQGKTARDAKVMLELPIRLSRRDVRLAIIPLKDKNENVESAIIFFAPES
ncbi:MAG: PAS domain-containing protein [Candidatus Omnitrophota bacterium]